MAKKPLSIVDLNYSTSQKGMIDTINGNMGKIKQYLMNLSVVTPDPDPATVVYLESGVGEYPYSSTTEFVLVNGYTEEPIVTTGFRGLDSEFISAVEVRVDSFIMEEIGGVPDCYSGIVVRLKSDNLPYTATDAKVYIHAICRGAVKRT